MKRWDSRLLYLLLTLVAETGCRFIPPAPSINTPNLLERLDDCGFTGNPDPYGLGIRLGVYFQWISAFIIYRWYSKGGKEPAGDYLVFFYRNLYRNPRLNITCVLYVHSRSPCPSLPCIWLFLYGEEREEGISKFSR